MNFKNFIPMSETAYYILLSLTDELHGYGVMQHISNLTHDRITLGAGTLYGTLSKLEKASLITITREEDKRKYYKITSLEILLMEINGIRLCIDWLQKMFPLNSTGGIFAFVSCCIFSLVSILLLYFIIGILVEKNRIKSRLNEKL